MVRFRKISIAGINNVGQVDETSGYRRCARARRDLQYHDAREFASTEVLHSGHVPLSIPVRS